MDKVISEPVEKLISKTLIFKGDEESPLLAPRGVYLVNNQLFVADTAQNRLFIWHSLQHLDIISHR